MSEVRGIGNVLNAWRQIVPMPFGAVVADEREDLLEFIEEPLRGAIGIMFDKNVPTVGSSCNLKDYYEGRAYINIYYDYMTAQNQKVTDRHLDLEKFTVHNRNLGRIVTVSSLFLPISEHDLPVDVSERAVSLAERFYKQPKSLPRNF